MSTELRVDGLKKRKKFTAEQKLAIHRSGMEETWQWRGDNLEVSATSPESVSMEGVHGRGGEGVTSGGPSEEERGTQAVGGGESEAEGGSGDT